MKRRRFISSLGALAVSCMMAGGLSWKSIKTGTRVAVINPEWVNAKYEVRFIFASGFQGELWPARSNNPNAMRDKDFIPPFVEVDA